MHVRIANLFLAAIFTVFAANPVVADMAQKPLFVTAAVKPNIVFLLDDSGSMHFESMPDGFRYTNYVFPRPSNVYGDGDYANQVPNFDDDNYHNYFGRSPENNSVFYNPDIDYKPWVKSDGTRMDDAEPTCAYYNPMRTGRGCLDLTSQATQEATWFSGNGPTDANCDPGCGVDHTFWPITYFNYTGGDRSLRASYTKVEITASTPSGTTFTSPSGKVRTLGEEIQNFANWFTYHRSRILTARGGIGEAFGTQGDRIRVGYGAINVGSQNVDSVVSDRAMLEGVRTFEGTSRDTFYELLYDRDIPNEGTPLRTALVGAGEYFERDDNKGPASTTPGSAGGERLGCRSNYTILMSDGFWNGDDPELGNVDDTDGSEITGPNNQSYTYAAEDPFDDGHSDTLADVAMHYWNRDLTGLDNKVPTSDRDPAFWQHMVTYTIGLGVSGSIDPDTAFDAVESGANINWPDPHGADQAKIDDMLHAAVNSRGGFFSATEPDVFASELQAVLDDIVSREEGSSASIATNSTRLDTDTLIFQARFDSADWSGELLAFRLDDQDGTVSDTPAWSAEDGIDGLRNIVTFVPQGGLTDGIDPNDPSSGSTRQFEWNDLNNWQKDALRTNPETGTQDSVTVGQQRLNWLWGNQSDEIQNGGNLRDRDKLLADVVNSDPLYIGGQDYGYWTLIESSGDKWDDYRDFVNDVRDNEPSLLVGANDGKLHAFEAETGEEIFSYVPNMVYPDLSAVSSSDYEHRYLVDGNTRMNDVHNGTEWRRMVVGTLGAGGRGVFALDVTDIGDSVGTYTPEVLWEITDDHANFGNLGHIVGSATIALMQDGNWYAIFGNGYDSSTETASIYLVEMTDPSNVIEIDTEETGGNGMSSPIPIDFDGDRITDTIYAGDLHGNLWEVDVTDSNSNKWELANKGNPLFTTEERNDEGGTQPIMGRPEVGLHDDGGVMVFFGTGKYFEPGDGTVGNDPVVQSFYGIRDRDPLSTDTGGGGGGGAVVERDELVKQEITHELSEFGFDLRVTSDNEVTDDKEGWYIDLISPDDVKDGERSVARPILRGNRIIFTTLIPSQDRCAGGGDGWLMEMNAMTGARLDSPPFDLNEDGEFTEGDNVDIPNPDGSGGTITVPVSGKRSRVGIIQPPGIVSSGDTEYKYSAGSSGEIERTVEQGDDSKGRRSWRERQ